MLHTLYTYGYSSTNMASLAVGGEDIKTTQMYSDTEEDALHKAHYQYSPVDDEIDSNKGSM
jgi:hypothetical protein